MNDFLKDYRDLDIYSQWEIVKLFFNLESSFRFCPRCNKATNIKFGCLYCGYTGEEAREVLKRMTGKINRK